MKKSAIAFGFLVACLVFTAQACPPNGKRLMNKATSANAGYTKLESKNGGAGVEMSYKMVGTPTVGKSLTINVSMSSSTDAETTIKADSGLTLQDPVQVLRTTARQKSEHVITLTPQADGRFYVNLFSTAEGRTSATSFAVQVGAAQASSKSTANVQTAPNGERIKVLPVQ
jgi:hypothetical protein